MAGKRTKQHHRLSLDDVSPNQLLLDFLEDDKWYLEILEEAQVLGCTILVSDCSGNREQVENGTDGILCQLSPEDISRKISELLENEEKCREYGKKATVRISDEQGDILKLFEIV